MFSSRVYFDVFVSYIYWNVFPVWVPCFLHRVCGETFYLLLKDSSAGDSILVCRVSLFQHLWNILSHFILTFKSFCLEILQPCKVFLICSESLFFGAFNVLPVSALCLQEQGSAHLAHCSRCHVFPFPCFHTQMSYLSILRRPSQKVFLNFTLHAIFSTLFILFDSLDLLLNSFWVLNT